MPTRNLTRVLARILAGALACLALLAPGGAFAHATLTGTLPGDGTVLSVSPQALEVRFDDGVDPLLFILQDGASHVLSSPAPTKLDDGKVLRVALPAKLPAGGYRVIWRALSDDGHPEGGVFVFRVGPGPMPSKILGTQDGWEAARMLLRACRDLGFLLAAGGAAFALYAGASSPRWPVRITALAGIVFALLDFTVYAAETGLRVSQVWQPLLIVMGLGAILAGPARIAAAGAVTAAAGIVLGSHVASAGMVARPLLALHILAAAFWLGALWPLWALLRAPQPARPAIERFSRLAIWDVALLVLTGALLAILQVKTPAALITSRYGWLLLVKLGLVTTVLTIAWRNKTHFTPRLPEDAAGFARAVDIELALMTVIVAVTALLAESPIPGAA